MTALCQKFTTLEVEYDEYMRAIDKSLAKYDPLPVNVKYLANRMESTLRPLGRFFADSIAMANGGRVPTAALLQRLRSRHLWYTKNKSGWDLVKKTREDADKRIRELLATHGSRMTSRIELYRQDRLAGLSKKEIKSNPSSVSEIADARTDAIRDDPEHSVGTDHWSQVDDNPPANQDSKSSTVTKFINMYHPSAMLMLENYRDRSKGYFASDAVFDQWMRVAQVETLDQLPAEFPQYIYRNHIDNALTRKYAETLLGNKEFVWVAVGSKDWETFKVTDNVKSTLNILGEYNKINARRELPSFKCIGVLIYKGPSLKFTFEQAGG